MKLERYFKYIPSTENKAADCLSRRPYITRKRNDNPLHDEMDSIQIKCIRTEDTDAECRLCNIDLIDTLALKQQDTHCS